MNQIHTIDIINVRKILNYCPYYDEIINYEADDEFSFDIIDWYKDFIFLCNGDDKVDARVVREIDRGMYFYINNSRYRNGLKKCINIRNMDLNDNRSTKKMVRKIINYTNRYEELEILDISSSKWI